MEFIVEYGFKTILYITYHKMCRLVENIIIKEKLSTVRVSPNEYK